MRYRHIKRGSTYRLIGAATVAPGRTFVEGESLRWGCYLSGDRVAKAPEAPFGENWRTGGYARLQAGAMVLPGDKLALYRAEAGGVHWLRPWDEFFDGRFERIFPDGRFEPTASHVEAAEPLRRRVAELERQRDDLLAANNAYLQRFRDAERALAAERKRNEFDRAVIAAALALPDVARAAERAA